MTQRAETDALREQIEHTRHELGDTVEALAAKADVKARAMETADRIKTGLSVQGQSLARQTRARRGPISAVGAGTVSLAVAAIVVRHRLKARRVKRWPRWNRR